MLSPAAASLDPFLLLAAGRAVPAGPLLASRGGSIGLLLGVLGVGLMLILAAGVVWMGLRDRRGRRIARGYGQGFAGPSGSAAPAAQAPVQQDPLASLSVAELRSRAGTLLVQTDDAVARSDQEIAFAQAQYGEDQTGPFRQALDEARAHLQRSFQLQKQLDDDIPDTEQEQRSWLGEIIDRCEQAQRTLRDRAQDFSNLRQLESRAAEELGRLDQELEALGPRIEAARPGLAALVDSYAPSATEQVRDNLDEAAERLDFARKASSEGSAALAGGDRSTAVLRLRPGEEAAGQVRGLLEAVEHSREELAHADQALDDALAQARTDLAEAEALVGRGGYADLAGGAAAVRSVLETIEKERTEGRTDPLAQTRRLQESRRELDRGLGSVRDQNQQDRAARQTLAHTLVSAQAQISAASDYVWSRRGGVQSPARTRLSEAERNLERAQELRASDPAQALDCANSAIRLAEEARRMATGDVQDFSSRGGWGGGGMGSAVLGGILLGTVLGGHEHRQDGRGADAWNGGGFAGGPDDGFDGGFF